jgi:fructose transport system substrate-binding protein
MSTSRLRLGRMSSRVAIAGAVGAIAVGVVACGSDSDSGSSSSSGSSGGGGGDKVVVGLITKTESNPFFVKMKEAAQKAADANNAELVTAAGKEDTDNQSQVTAIENMVTRGAKGILITPSDSKAIVPSIKKARDAGVTVIALDTPTEPQDAANALFATDNMKAGELIGAWAKAKFAKDNKQAKIVTIDLAPGISVGVLRHNGFLKGFGATDKDVLGHADAIGDQTKAQAAMENLLQKVPDVNLVYTINEPSAFGAYTALKAAGKEKQATIVSVDGGCNAIEKGIKPGIIAATSQQYPQNMAKLGVEAIAKGEKVSGYKDTGVTLITDDPQDGVDSKDSTFGAANCWG